MWLRKKQDLDRHDSADSSQPSDDMRAIARTGGLGAKSLIFACGAALFSDGFVNAGIGPVNTILRLLYPEEVANTNYGQLLSSMAFAGTIVGMLVFGLLSDLIGRKIGMLIATAIIFVFTALSAASKGAGGSTTGMLQALIAYRFLLGIGIGAEYPSGSVACSENTEAEGVSKTSQQMWFSLATNSMIDLGFVAASFVPLIILWIAGMDHLPLVWRLSLGLGVIPPLALLFFRVKMHEPESFIKNRIERRDIPYKLIIKRYWVKFLAVSFSWALYDFIVYPFGLYSSVIIAKADKESTLYTSLGWGVLVNAFYLPGTLIGAIFISDRLGPKYTMIGGLIMQATIGFALSAAYTPLTEADSVAGFAILYGLFLSMGEVGPGNNLGLLASKAIGPTCVRGQLYGMAAAIGKIGAFVGTYAFPKIQAGFGAVDSYKYNTGPFWLGSGLALLSALVIFLFVPNIGPDYMEMENAAFRAYLEQNGYDTTLIGALVDAVDPERLDVPTVGKKAIDDKDVVEEVK